MNDIDITNYEILDKFNTDFITEFGGLDASVNATDGDGIPYYKDWKGCKYFEKND